MKGAPYSADVVIENSQTLADGNRIDRKSVGHVYRDGEGRIRREDERPVSVVSNSGAASQVVLTTISILDPVAGFSYSLDPEQKIAWKTPMAAGGAIMGEMTALKRKMDTEEAAAAEKRAIAEKLAVEGARAGEVRVRSGGGEMTAADKEKLARGRGGVLMPRTPEAPLEHKTIEGLAVEGRKTTAVIPAGQIGNEQPITITSEEWRSPDLSVLVMTRHSDPRSGESGTG